MTPGLAQVDFGSAPFPGSLDMHTVLRAARSSAQKKVAFKATG